VTATCAYLAASCSVDLILGIGGTLNFEHVPRYLGLNFDHVPGYLGKYMLIYSVHKNVRFPISTIDLR
jgi:hypothetical protein